MITLDCPHTKSMLRMLFEERGVRIRKQWGQNFLIDQNILQFIIKSAEINRNDIVLEIGAGTGSLTMLLAEKAGHVFAVEIDRKLSEILTDTLASFNNVSIINKDILKSKHYINPEVIESISKYLQSIDGESEKPGIPPKSSSPARKAWSDRVRQASSIKVISNLPYYISTPVIIDLLLEVLPIEMMVLTLQKDITNRLRAKPGTKDYGLLSIMIGLFGRVKVLKKLPPDVFWPAPLIDSAIIKMEIGKDKLADRISNFGTFQGVVKAIYVSRRKTIVNSLLPLCSRKDIKNEVQKTREDLVSILNKVGIGPKSRGEELDIEKLIELSNEVSKVYTDVEMVFEK